MLPTLRVADALPGNRVLVAACGAVRFVRLDSLGLLARPHPHCGRERRAEFPPRPAYRVALANFHAGIFRRLTGPLADAFAYRTAPAWSR